MDMVNKQAAIPPGQFSYMQTVHWGRTDPYSWFTLSFPPALLPNGGENSPASLLGQLMPASCNQLLIVVVKCEEMNVNLDSRAADHPLLVPLNMDHRVTVYIMILVIHRTITCNNVILAIKTDLILLPKATQLGGYICMLIGIQSYNSY